MKRKKVKFDEADRRKVIAELEQIRGISLKQVGSRKKHLKDQNGREYWVLGGVEDWHGVPADMMESGLSNPSNVELVIARRLKYKIEIFMGPAAILITNRKSLTHTQKGDFQFDVQGLPFDFDALPNIADDYEMDYDSDEDVIVINPQSVRKNKKRNSHDSPA